MLRDDDPEIRHCAVHTLDDEVENSGPALALVSKVMFAHCGEKWFTKLLKNMFAREGTDSTSESESSCSSVTPYGSKKDPWICWLRQG